MYTKRKTRLKRGKPLKKQNQLKHMLYLRSALNGMLSKSRITYWFFLKHQKPQVQHVWHPFNDKPPKTGQKTAHSVEMSGETHKVQNTKSHWCQFINNVSREIVFRCRKNDPTLQFWNISWLTVLDPELSKTLIRPAINWSISNCNCRIP